MRSAGNFSPEWGYLAPVPSFMRTLRVVVVATAVGATAGAAVVLSLVDRPASGSGMTAVTAHAIVTAVQAAPVATLPPSNAAPAAAAVAAVSVTATPSVTTASVSTPPLPQPQISTPIPVQAAVQSPAQPEAATAPTESDVAPAPRIASGIAALSGDPASSATSDAPDLGIAVPEPLPPQKKIKHNTGPNAATGKQRPEPGLGSVLRRLFSASAARPSVH